MRHVKWAMVLLGLVAAAWGVGAVQGQPLSGEYKIGVLEPVTGNLAVAAAPEVAGVRVWHLMSRGRGPRGGRPVPEGANVAYASRRRTLQFFEGLYVDLHHLVANLATASGNSRIANACREVQLLIEGRETRSPFIAQGHIGPRMTPARGISI